MKVLITGSKGQLGNEMQIASQKYPQMQCVFTDVDELDICNFEALTSFLTENPVDFIVNCAAYTAVDKAEDEVELAYKINDLAAANLGKIASAQNIKVIHVSTDYVFDGTSHIPYSEEMEVCPVSVYGKSKLAGELSLQKVCAASAVIRTSWLYSSFGNNFVKTMIRLGKERDQLKVVFDQIGTPTYAADLATAICEMITADVFVPGVYHYSNEGVCSWYDFTISIHRKNNIQCEVLPILSSEYPAKAPRPHYSVLNKNKIKSTYGIQIPHWEDGLSRCLEVLNKNA